MIADVVALVYPVIMRALAFKDLLRTGSAPGLERAQNEFIQGLSPEVSEAWSEPGRDEVRYALTCWLDEIFIDQPSPWSVPWKERKLEMALFHSNDRAWSFWRRANQALALGDADLVEVYLLCVLLGFRGPALRRPEPAPGMGRRAA